MNVRTNRLDDWMDAHHDLIIGFCLGILILALAIGTYLFPALLHKINS